MMGNETDTLAYRVAFGGAVAKADAALRIRELAKSRGVFFASIYPLYRALAQGILVGDFTVPALNIRGMTYDCARAIFRVAKRLDAGAFVFELARSEMEYTLQRPAEYAAVIMAAALAEGWSGPVFVGGDHFQFKAGEGGELAALKILAKEALAAGFYNIDIDASTLVDLAKTDERAQQAENVRNTLELARYIREIQPKDITVSIGGEIGHIGGRNSTVADLKAFLEGFLAEWPKTLPSLSKISIQTGTSHGGTILPTGELANPAVDLAVIPKLSALCKRYKIAGVVQHGASTLSNELLGKFPLAGAVEIHLATGIQNGIMDHSSFPQLLQEKISKWIESDLKNEWEPTWNSAQAVYKLRKKAWGRFKEEIWNIDPQAKIMLTGALEEKVANWFGLLNIADSKRTVDSLIRL